MVIPGIEGDDDLAVPSLAEGDPMTIVGILKERNNHAGEGMTVPERVCNAVLPFYKIHISVVRVRCPVVDKPKKWSCAADGTGLKNENESVNAN